MGDKNRSEKKPNWVLGIVGVFFLIGFLIFFIAYFKNVSIGEWVAKENYSSTSEWFKQTGLFIATMVAFEEMFAFVFECFEYLPFLHKKKSEDLRTKK